MEFRGIPIVWDESFAQPGFCNPILLNPRFLNWRYRRKWRGKIMCYRAPHPMLRITRTT